MKQNSSNFLICTAFLLAPVCANASSVSVGVVKMQLVNETRLVGAVKSRVSEEIRPQWPILIEKFHVKPGSSVKKGDLIASGDKSHSKFMISFAKRRLFLAEAALDSRQLAHQKLIEDTRRNKRLVKEGVQAKVTLNNLNTSMIDSQQALYSAEKSLEAAKTYLNEAIKRSNQSNYYAPIAGTVTEMDFNPDQIVGSIYARSNQLLARIEVPKNYLLKAAAFDTQIKNMRIGDDVKIHIYPDKHLHDGKIEDIQIDLKFESKESKRFIVTAGFTLDEVLPTKMSAQLVLTTSSDPVLALPWSALKEVNRNYYVRPIDRTPDILVKIGRYSSNYVEILDGLNADQEVLADLW